MRKPSQTKFRRIIRGHLLASSRPLAFAFLCTLGIMAMEMAAPWPLKLIFDHVLLGRQLPGGMASLQGLVNDHQVLAVVVISSVMLLTACLRGVFAYLQLYVTSRIGYRLVHLLRRELFAHFQRLSLAFHNKERKGELLTQITTDTATLKDIFGDSLVQLATQVLTIAGMFAVMFAISPKLSITVVATFPVLWYVLFVVYRRIKASARRQREREGRVSSRIGEVLQSMNLVQAFTREEFEQNRFDSEIGATLEESVRTARLEAAASRAMEIISAAGLWLTVLVGAVEVLGGRLTPGHVLVFTSYLAGMYKPMRQLARLSSQLSKAMASAERIERVLETEAEPDDSQSGLSLPLEGEIRFRGVAFQYGVDRQVLRDVSFHIAAGERVAIVGGSGAGKSTIVSLLLRFYEPSAGGIEIDGRSVRAYQRQCLRQQIGVVLQDVFLFGASIRENIAYGNPDATLEQIVEAARQAHIHDFIEMLPEGYDTVVGDRGSTLSGGQRQRICLARAIIRRPQVLILDEPTSAVDSEAAAQILAAVNRVHAGKTLIYISHQFSGLEQFDRILVLRKGRLVESGTHTELLLRQGYYFELWRLQKGKEFQTWNTQAFAAIVEKSHS